MAGASIVKAASVVVGSVGSSRSSKKYATEQVSDPEKDQNHHRDDQCDQSDHSQEPGLVVWIVHSIDARL
jgi:hypothetical protein